MGGWIDRYMDEWMYSGWMDGWMVERWMDGSIDEWINGRMNR